MKDCGWMVVVVAQQWGILNAANCILGKWFRWQILQCVYFNPKHFLKIVFIYLFWLPWVFVVSRLGFLTLEQSTGPLVLSLSICFVILRSSVRWLVSVALRLNPGLSLLRVENRDSCSPGAEPTNVAVTLKTTLLIPVLPWSSKASFMPLSLPFPKGDWLEARRWMASARSTQLQTLTMWEGAPQPCCYQWDPPGHEIEHVPLPSLPSCLPPSTRLSKSCHNVIITIISSSLGVQTMFPFICACFSFFHQYLVIFSV